MVKVNETWHWECDMCGEEITTKKNKNPLYKVILPAIQFEDAYGIDNYYKIETSEFFLCENCLNKIYKKLNESFTLEVFRDEPICHVKKEN